MNSRRLGHVATLSPPRTPTDARSPSSRGSTCPSVWLCRRGGTHRRHGWFRAVEADDSKWIGELRTDALGADAPPLTRSPRLRIIDDYVVLKGSSALLDP